MAKMPLIDLNDAPKGATQAASSPPVVLKSAYKHMNINIDTLSDSEVTMEEMKTLDNSGNVDSLVAVDLVKKPAVIASDGDSDSDSDWQQCPSTPGARSASSVDADESVTVIQEPPQYSNWFDNIGSTETKRAESAEIGHSTANSNANVGQATSFVHRPLGPLDMLNDIHIPIWPIPTSAESVYMNKYERFWEERAKQQEKEREQKEREQKEQEQKEREQDEREKKERDILREAKGGLDAPSIASGIPGPASMPHVGRGDMENPERGSPMLSRGIQRETSREIPPPLRVAPRSNAPYPPRFPSPCPASTPSHPCAACESGPFPAHLPPTHRNDLPNPFATQVPRRRRENFYSDYVPTEPPMSPAPPLSPAPPINPYVSSMPYVSPALHAHPESRMGPVPLPAPGHYHSLRPAMPPAPTSASQRMLDTLQSQEARNAWRHYGMNDDELVPDTPLPPFSLRVPGAGSANGNGSRAGTHASNSDTITQEHISHQRELQKFVGLLSDLLHDEVRNVAKTVFELTNDLYEMRADITNLRREMDLLKKERDASSGNGSNGGLAAHAIPVRPFPTHYYPSDSDRCPPLNIRNDPRPSFTSPRMPGPSPRVPGPSPRLPSINYASHSRVPLRTRLYEPIREHSTTGSLADDEPRSDWGMQGPQSIHDYMGTHDFGRGNGRDNYRDDDRDNDPWTAPFPGMDSRTYNDDRPARNRRSNFPGPFGLRPLDAHGTRDARDSHDARDARDARDDRDGRDSETLPPYTYRHNAPVPRGLHSAVGNNDWTNDEASVFEY